MNRQPSGSRQTVVAGAGATASIAHRQVAVDTCLAIKMHFASHCLLFYTADSVFKRAEHSSIFTEHIFFLPLKLKGSCKHLQPLSCVDVTWPVFDWRNILLLCFLLFALASSRATGVWKSNVFPEVRKSDFIHFLCDQWERMGREMRRELFGWQLPPAVIL